MNTEKIELTIISPMYNEEENVISTFSAIEETMKNFGMQWEVLFINDGSTDRTLQIAQDLEKERRNLRVLSYPLNRGRGYALRTGFDNARGDYIVSIDFDLSYHPDHILKLYTAMKEDESIDAVLGSPYMAGGAAIGIPTKRLFISKMSNRFINIFFPGNIKTSTCILRGYKQEVITALDLGSNDKEIHLEILSKLLSLGYLIKEIPATLTARKMGSSKFNFFTFIRSHLEYSLLERPAILFGFLGFFCLLVSVLFAAKLFYDFTRGTLNPERPLVNATIVLVVAGLQILLFSIMTLQLSELRKEVLKIQRDHKVFLKKRS